MWLASTRTLANADPSRIADSEIRAEYHMRRQAWQNALAAVQQPEEALPPLHMGSMVRSEAFAERRISPLGKDQAAPCHSRTVQRDSGNHSGEGRPIRLLRRQFVRNITVGLGSTNACRACYCLVSCDSLGGMALTLFSANPQTDEPKRFAVLELPELTTNIVETLTYGNEDKEMQRKLGGFMCAQNGSIFDYLVDQWIKLPERDRSRLLTGWEITTRTNRLRVYLSTPLSSVFELLHDVCQQQQISSTFDAACQEVAKKPELQNGINDSNWAANYSSRYNKSLIDHEGKWTEIAGTMTTPLSRDLCHIFLRKEIEHCQDILSINVIQPLAAWLREQGTTTATIIPCGQLTAFPLLACTINSDGMTFAEAFNASVAPSARSLWPQPSHTHRQGVATLGNPLPSHQPLRFGEAEATSLAYLGGEPKRYRIQGEATKAWLIQCLQEADVVDVSSHGVAKLDYLESSLHLADGTLTLANILNQQITDPMGMRLLILSACETAIPNLTDATDEVRSLAISMVQAGVRAVIASLWPVDDRATYLLMVRFAQEWFPKRQTEPPSAALARAQRWLRTVTLEELSQWTVKGLLPHILSAMPSYRNDYQQETGQSGTERLEVVRGGDSYPVDESSWFAFDKIDRYSMGQAQNIIRDPATHSAEMNPLTKPYVHPFFWAGFQVIGW